MFNRSVNKVVLIGNLGKDPELRDLSTGSAVVKLTLATKESWKSKQTGERQEATEWHQLIVFNQLADLCSRYLKTGMKIYIEGRIQTKKWRDKMTGGDRYSTSVVVSEIQLLDSQKNNAEKINHTVLSNVSDSLDLNDRLANKAVSKTSWGKNPNDNNEVVASADFFDDEIPF